LFEDLEKIEDKKKTLIVFSSHSLPASVVFKGDRYPYEINTTAYLVNEELKRMGVNLPYTVVWQSKVGPKAWLKPSLLEGIANFHSQGFTNLIVTPLGFTSDHIETLHELDIEMMEEVHKYKYEKVVRGRSLNDHPLFV